ncbi:hypothetical protein [Sorangium sp. So ce1078]|uniref:hypothetical protein n=1 Tax=Sorangium sp. So ce1078 TaxID=3133329 RepID=UPI003F62F8B4
MEAVNALMPESVSVILAPVGSFPRGAGRWGQLDLAGEAYEVTRDAAADDDRLLMPCADC